MKMLALLEVKYLFFLRHVYPSVLPFIQEISAEDLLSTVFWNEWCLALGQGTVNENCCCCSVTTSCQTLCDPHGLHHAKLPCPSLSPGMYSNSCPLSQWCHPTVSSCVSPFSSCLQSFPASESFPMSQPFTSGGQSIGASAFFLKMLEWLEVKCLFCKACSFICSPIHPRNICWGFTTYPCLEWTVPGTGRWDNQGD